MSFVKCTTSLLQKEKIDNSFSHLGCENNLSVLTQKQALEKPKTSFGADFKNRL